MTPADVAQTVERAREQAGGILATIRDRSTATAEQAIRQTDAAIEKLAAALTLAAYEAARQEEVQAAREARGQVDQSFKRKVK